VKKGNHGERFLGLLARNMFGLGCPNLRRKGDGKLISFLIIK
jgi:hypothetical protein